jgi:hypothetical protein
MTRDDISRMAEAAGFPARRAFSDLSDLYPRLERFAALVAAAEREACAKVCENMSLEWQDQPNIAQAELATIMDCALAIRAKGKK